MINNAVNLSPPVRLPPPFIRVDFNSTSCAVAAEKKKLLIFVSVVKSERK